MNIENILKDKNKALEIIEDIIANNLLEGNKRNEIKDKLDFILKTYHSYVYDVQGYDDVEFHYRDDIATITDLSEIRDSFKKTIKYKVGDYVRVGTYPVEHYGIIIADRTDWRHYVGENNGYEVTGLYQPINVERNSHPDFLMGLISKEKYDKVLNTVINNTISDIDKLSEENPELIDEELIANTLGKNQMSNTITIGIEYGKSYDIIQSIFTRTKFKKYKVDDVNTIEEFLSKYYKSDRSVSLYNSYKNIFEKNGYVVISKQDSCTGDIVSFFKQNKNDELASCNSCNKSVVSKVRKNR